MEVPDILPWIKKGDFILTTGYAFKDDIEAQKDLGGISEDDIKRQLEELQKAVEKTNLQIDALKQEKETDLMTV